ncbi:restriction endonuclease subunit S [Escherichia coli]|uniref:restriction endonuclease subunit S n=1 Tax=Escherichia coli TaxID=562 RepID=UPI0020226EB7|nr:restriction endonuclease subunit S [Escherichia coli]
MESLALMPKYEAYKDSQVQWIGDIPANWHLEKAKWLFYKADRKPLVDDDIVTCFRDGQVTLRKNRRTEGFTNALKEHGYQRICKGDLVIHAMDAFAGAIGVSDSDGKSTPVYAACVPRKIGKVNSYYYAYYMRDLALSGFIVSLAKGIRERSTDFRFNDFAELLLPFPDYEEQTLIAAFLDKKTALIDEAISIKEKQINLLKERKQIIIQQAVTQGLDPNVPMKDSGVDWIGKIPAHWKIKPLKHILKLQNVKIEAGKSNLEYLGMECVNSFDGTKNEIKSEADGLSTFFQVGNILFGKLRPYLAKVYLADFEGVCSTEFLVYEVKVGSNTFFSKLMLSNGFISVVDASTYGSKMPRASSEFIGNLKLVNPPLEEQIKIASFIDKQNELFDMNIALQKMQIEKLKEYKTTLINSAVTGKIKITPEMVEQ